MQLEEITNLEKQWRDVEFEETLTVYAIYRDRSAAGFYAHSADKTKKFTIFLADMLDMIIAGKLEGNVIQGTFIVKKDDTLLE